MKRTKAGDASSFAQLVEELEPAPKRREAPKPREVASTEPVSEFNVESNLGLLGLGGTGCRVTSQVFQDDPMPMGLGSSFGFDLDADERIAAKSKLYKYNLIRHTGGIPAAGVFAFSELVASKILQTPLAELDASAGTFSETIRRLCTTSLYNVSMPVFSAGGGVGHGFFRAITSAYAQRKTFLAPLVVFPGRHQNLGIQLSACGVVGRLLARRTRGTPPLFLVAENDYLQSGADNSRLVRRNQRIVESIQMVAAGLEAAFLSGSAGGNIDRALLNLVQGGATSLATIGTATRVARGNGILSLVSATQDALGNLLARERDRGRYSNGGGVHHRRAIVFATVPPRVNREEAKRALEESSWNDPARGFEIVGKFIGPAPSGTVDVAVVATGNFVPTFFDANLRNLSSKFLDDQLDERRAAAQFKLESLQGGGWGVDQDVAHATIESAFSDIRSGLELLQGALA